jgi:DNA-directed RNA polymerase subunit RPC12/RpoP
MRDPEIPSRTPQRRCVRCGEVKAHEVSISIQEGTTRDDVRGENEKFSRRPHVVYRCPDCGRSTARKVE